MTRSTTRRALIGGAGLLAVAGVAQCAAPAHGATAAAAGSTRLRRLIALQKRAELIAAAYWREVGAPAHAALKAAHAAYVAEPEPPHRTTTKSFVNINGERRTFSTDGFSCEMGRRVRDWPEWADMCEEDPEWHAAHVELADLADERDAIIAEQQRRRKDYEHAALARLNIVAINRRYDQLCDRDFALWDRAMAEPAETLADVVLKIDLTTESGRDLDDPSLIVPLVADIRRLAAGEVA
ncbi:hypothetical protein [Sphingomonas sp. BK235]|uniref:hypothetical protein n=1 Tax=Sphingomonas sp. BK235 TaxID=2512131 RepID=UPI00104BF6A7|nr:hypothetical protein [Sphingomonas sp. BK235]TCP36531.1 hypothetical protein EV292_10127 [Sphingomonas sp. BK235]